MKFLDLFTTQHIHHVLKSTVSYYSDKSGILFSADKCNNNENFMLLNVTGDGFKQKYVLVKIPKIPGGITPNYKVTAPGSFPDAYPVFILKSINNDCYGAFQYQHGMEDFVPPHQNNTESLKIILQNLAEYQAAAIANSDVTVKPSEYNLKDISEEVISLDFFKDLDTAIISQSIKNLEQDLKKLQNGFNVLVKSICWPFGGNVYVTQDMDRSIFFIAHLAKVVPPAYDALFYIFALSDEKFRQKHFEDLILHYFQSLTQSLEKLQSSIANEITRWHSEHQVRILLPVVKFEVANSFIKSNKTDHQDILRNIKHFLKYPLINQEDIYEVIRNKTGSSEFDLLDYKLTRLSEKNGHLGEYFHLDIKIKIQKKEQNFQLFAKFLITSTEVMEALLKGGPSRKEDFFYKTLIPLLSRHGLDSLLDFAPKCYLSRVDWLLILDDLFREGFIAFKHNTVLNYEGLKAIVKKFAQFHSCTIILEEILSQESGKAVRLDDIYGMYFQESTLIFDNDDHPLKGFLESTLEALYYVVGKFPELTEKLNLSPKEIKSRLEKLFLTLFSKTRKSDSIRNAINHGDVFITNMLVKMNEDKLIINGILVDFQMLRYVSPCSDLLIFLFYSSTKETRDKYFKILIEEYYQYVSENIRQFNFDPEKIFPKNVFDKNIQFMMSAGMMGGFMYAHMFHIDSNLREEITNDDEKYARVNKHKDELVELSWNNEHYRTILKGFVEDIVDLLKNDV